MRGVILDADSLGTGVDLSPVTSMLDHWDVFPSTLPAETAARIEGAAVVLTNKIVIDDVLMRSPSLRFISVMATGTNNIDLSAARDRDIHVSNAVAYATPSVVQHTLNLILALATHLPEYIQDVRNGAWQSSNVFCRLDHPIIELSGKALGIIGYGELGSSVADVARAFGMHILIADRPGVTTAREGRHPFDTVLAEADFLSLHCPLTADNAGFINARTLAKMQPTSFLVNTARGALVNSNDLLEALRRGTIAGAAVDVLDGEPPAADEPLTRAGLANLIVTPHNAWGALEARQRLIGQMAENIQAFLDGTPVRKVS